MASIRKLIFVSFLLFFTGCAPFLIGAGVGSERSADHSVAGATQKTRDNLEKIVYGLSMNKVLETMGKKPIRASIGEEIISIPNPYRIERMRGVKSMKLEVVYYVTDVKDESSVFTDDELTPLIFIEGKLSGWGWPYLNAYRQKYKLRTY